MERTLDTTSLASRTLDLLLAGSSDPKAADHYYRQFAGSHPDLLARLAESPSGLQCLFAVFSHSRFLSEELLRRPEWIEELASSPDLMRVLSASDYATQLDAALVSEVDMPLPSQLAMFRRRALLRILVRDVLGHAELAETTEELSSLADAILHVSYLRVRSELTRRYGAPMDSDRDGVEAGFSIIALGKLGARELNYSSDIDLMFVYSGNGETSGPDSISNKEFFKRVANSLTDLLSSYTAEGLCYRVDLRLRPDGRLGEVSLSLDGCKSYYERRARDWELQMLIKARVVAGEPEPGRELLDFTEPLIYASTLDFSAVEAVSATRTRIHEKLAKRRGEDSIDVKLARGGIRDIEFLVQCLQRLHGGRERWLRHASTLMALLRLRDKHLLSVPEYSRLATAYEFLRHLEHRLQFFDDRQTHVLPMRKEELELLARKMPRREIGRQPTSEKLLHRLNLHLEEVQETYDRVIHSQQPLYYSAPAQTRDDRDAEPDLFTPPLSNNLMRFLDDRAPGLAGAIGSRPLLRGGKALEHFLEKIYAISEHLQLLNRNSVLAHDVLEIFDNSPHFAEELTRHPELIEDLANVRTSSKGAPPGASLNLAALRQFFRREMFRIQAESICLGAPIFHTLARTSDLADQVIQSAYAMARDQVAESQRTAEADYKPADQLMVVALGRLGMREFDLGSDADLVFVIPDEDVGELLYWTRVAERLIDLISAYTGEGTMFAVDTRLRPNGREGNLVQTASAYREYLERRAEAWEGITYMKSRAVAGNPEAATLFLHQLQEVDWLRYGQSGRSRTELRNMRVRLENEQGGSSPLKAGHGGYYDIDFALMYLRLRSAGIFFKVLSTPERIEIIEEMGHLDRRDAVFLHEAAAFYRAIDHGLRVYSGHAEGRLPHSQAHLDTLERLVRRWVPDTLHDAPLGDKLWQIRSRTREFFTRVFY